MTPVGGVESDDTILWQHVERAPNSWLAGLPDDLGNAELLVADRDYWSPYELDEPAFAAGYSLAGKLHDELSTRREWVQRLDAVGFCCELWAEYTCIYRTLPMSSVIAFGDTLKAQAEGLGQWVAHTIKELDGLDPGDLALGHADKLDGTQRAELGA